MYARVRTYFRDEDDEDHSEQLLQPVKGEQRGAHAPEGPIKHGDSNLIDLFGEGQPAQPAQAATRSLQHPHRFSSSPNMTLANTDLLFDDLARQPTSSVSSQAAQQSDPHVRSSLQHMSSTRVASDLRHAASTNDLPQQGVDSAIDFEAVDGDTGSGRELFLYAIPLYQDDKDPVQGLVFLPVANFQDVADYSGFTGKVQEKIDKMQGKIAENWDKLKSKEVDTMGHKVYKVGHRVINDLTPEERLTKNIPRNVTKVIIYHPTAVAPDVIMEKLTSMTNKHGAWTAAKAAVASLMLPIAFGVDVIIIPGPSILTWYTSYQIYKNMSSAVGNQRLVQYLGDPHKAVRVNYAGDVRLDAYWELVQNSSDGVLDEEQCEQLVHDIDQQELLEPILELRRRKLEEKQKSHHSGDGQGSYQPLRCSEATHR